MLHVCFFLCSYVVKTFVRENNAVLSNSNDNHNCSSKKDRSYCTDYYCFRKKVILPSIGLRKNKVFCSLTNKQTNKQCFAVVAR